MVITGFGDIIAERMRVEHAALAGRWFDRLSSILPVEATEVFPTSSLLDHIPALIVDISGYLRAPEDEAIAASTTVLSKARELGALRHGQRASLHQVLREYQLLGSILVTFVREETARLALRPSPEETVVVVSRLHQAVNVLMQSTVETFVELYTRTISEQAERLEEFTRMATHEWRQPLGTLQFAIDLLRRTTGPGERSGRTLDLIERNVSHLVELTRKIEWLARIARSSDDATVQELSISTPAAEAARQLREMADARGVELRVARDLPTVVVDVGRLELVLLNLLSNGIKYSDPAKSARFVEVVGEGATADAVRLLVRDNGLGIPAGKLPAIFERFSRAHVDRDQALGVTGLGLGLSIVADCVKAIGGRIEVDSVEGEGSTFALTLPARPGSTQSADGAD